jgi:pyroglutamyl-peptidase
MNAPVLVTGFEPFDGESVNPSQAIVRALDGAAIAGHRVVGVSLPCEFGASAAALCEAIDRCQPTLVLALGQAGGRTDLSLERVAINVDDARIPDNAGAAPVDEPVVAEGPAAYFSTLPIKAMVAALRAQEIPASVSQSAGTYVCNHLFYALQHRLASGGVRSGFMHLPLLPEQAARSPGQPSMPLQTMLAGVRIALATALTTRHDLRSSGGAVS